MPHAKQVAPVGPVETVAEGGRHTVEIVDTIDAGWDAIVANFADHCLEQTASYMLTRWGSSRLCGILVRDVVSTEPEAAALAVVAALPVVKLGLAYIKFGPLWRRRDHPAEPDLLATALAALKHEFARIRGLLVRVMPPADPDYAREWAQATAAADFALHRPAESPARYLVDLALRADEQLASLGTKWRANLRKANSPALEISEVDPQAQLPAFMGLYGAMAERKQFVDRHHIDALPAFVAAAPASLNLRMFLARSGGRPVAGSIIAGAGERAFIPFSASSEDALPLRAGFALRWEIINRLRGSSARWLDLGGDEGDAGLRHFKEGNVGSRGRIVAIPGEFDYAENALSSAVTTAIGWARDLGQSGALQRLMPTANSGG
jgi:Acetyltransferase (GNAT) domain